MEFRCTKKQTLVACVLQITHQSPQENQQVKQARNLSNRPIYTKNVLLSYDLLVLKLSNPYIWRCPTQIIGQWFTERVSINHLDVGVGTGYYLKNHLPSTTKRLALVDTSPESLIKASQAVEHLPLTPELYRQSVLEPLSLPDDKFDSVSLNYLLHCLPGTMAEKSCALVHLKEVMHDGAIIFGSTILGKGIAKGRLAKKLMAHYNKKNIFHNDHDDFASLQSGLEQHFTDVKIRLCGCVALFSARHCVTTAPNNEIMK